MGRRREERVEGTDPGVGGLRAAVPVAELDLHGDRTETARRRLCAFLSRVARRHPGEAVRVITGRGRHSPDGPRLRPMVIGELRALRDRGEAVEAWESSLDGGSVIVRMR